MSEQTTPKPIICSDCGNLLGEEVCIDGVHLFHAGGILNREQRGWCIQCGAPFYWYTHDRPMQLVIRGLQMLKKDRHA